MWEKAKGSCMMKLKIHLVGPTVYRFMKGYIGAKPLELYAQAGSFSFCFPSRKSTF